MTDVDTSLHSTAGRVVGRELLTEVDGEPRLVGSACGDCGAVSFPAQASCPRCTGQNVEIRPLPRRGTLWGFTVQGFSPKSPYLGADAPFVPFGVGYVDLGDVLVASRLATDDLDGLQVGMAMELVLAPLPSEAGGESVVTFAFAPGVKDD
jgi:uncharacterized OB-fold protein